MIDEPLAACNVLITRSPRQAPAFAKQIEQRGGKTAIVPLIDTVPLSQEWQQQLDKLQKISSYHWIVFTSVNAVYFFKRALMDSGASLHSDTRIAAIGSKTARVLEQQHWYPNVVPRSFVAEELASVLMEKVKKGEKILLPKSELARHVIPEALRERGAEVDEMPLYTSAPLHENKRLLQAVIEEKRPDIFTFTSPFIVKTFVHFMEETQSSSLWKQKPIVNIGPITDEEAKKQGFVHRYMADPHTIEGMLAEIKKVWQTLIW